MNGRPLIPLALLFFAACSTSSKDRLITVPQPGLEEAQRQRVVSPPSEEDRAIAARAKEEVRRLLDFQGELLWSRWIGAEPPLSAPTKGETAWLLEARTLAAVERVRAAEGETAEGRLYRKVEIFLLGEALSEAVEVEEGEIRRLSQKRIANLGGELAAEPVSERRREIGARALDESDPLVVATAAKRRKLLLAMEELGRPDPLEVMGTLRGVETDSIVSLAQQVLQETDGLWAASFPTLAQRWLGLGVEEVRWVDLPRIFHSAGLEVRLRGATPLASLEQTLGLLELPLSAIPGLEVDREETGGKDSRPLCLPTAGGVRLSLPPGGGESHRALFREMGCVITAPSLVDEAGFPSADEAVVLAFTSLFEGITEDSAWLRQVGGLTEAEARTRGAVSAMRRLHRIRFHAARILVEIERSLGALEGEELEEAFSRTMERAFLFPVEGAWGALGGDDLLVSAGYLQAELLAAMLQDALAPGWWGRPSSKTLLEDLLKAGATGSDPLLQAMGEGSWDVAPFIRLASDSLAGTFVAPPK